MLKSPPTPPSRIAWIDSAKSIAMVVMVIDHALLYLGDQSHWMRATITRVAEPLFVLALFHVLVSRRRGLARRRWLQIAIASAIETALHSYRAGEFFFGILFSVAIVAPIVQRIANSNFMHQQCLVFGATVLAVVEIGPSSFHIDYGPSLLVGQICIASQLTINQRCLNLVSISIGATFATACILCAGGMPVSPNLGTLLIGQPVAIAFLWGLRLSHSSGRDRRGWIGRHPLTFYLGHLGLLQFLASLAAEAP
ncbi:MAG: TraX family protein [Verrucomicrobiales bacterium]